MLEYIFVSRTGWEKNENETAKSAHLSAKCEQEP